MKKEKNIHITVNYELYIPAETGHPYLVEKTSFQHPFVFITGMGYALEAFEKQIEDLAPGTNFEFDIPAEQAYGEYIQEHVIKLPKETFCIEGKFDETRIYPGNVIPLTNEDGNNFEGIVKEILDDAVVIDLNHPLAGNTLHFKGTILDSHPATIKEIQQFVNNISGEDECDGCCGHGNKCSDHHDCGCHGGCHSH